MSNSLQKEIIKRIFFNFGILFDKSELFPYIIREDFILPTSLVLEVGTKTFEKNIYAAELDLADSTGRVIMSDLSDNNFKEFVLMFQLNDFSTYGIRLSNDGTEYGTFAFQNSEKHWVPATIAVQCSFLLAVEQISGLFLNFKKIKNYEDLYDNLISFMSGEL